MRSQTDAQTRAQTAVCPDILTTVVIKIKSFAIYYASAAANRHYVFRFVCPPVRMCPPVNTYFV